MQLRHALVIAAEVDSRLAPYVTRADLAGSVRRERDEVKDIEILVTPKRIQVGGTLFDSGGELIVDPGFATSVRSLGNVVKGKPDGRYMKIELTHLYGRVNLDLFLPTEADYYRQFAIRTGSRDFAWNKIAVGWRKLGWVGTDDGLRRVEECENINEGKLGPDMVRVKPKWVCVNKTPTLPPVWRSEEEFFDWIQVSYVEPKYRNL